MSVLNAIRWILVAVLIAVLALPAAFVAISKVTVVEVDGGSMEPTIHFGDVAVIAPPTESDFVVGAIVTAEDAVGAKYTHRITQIKPDGTLQLKGDNNKVDDPAPVPTSAVIGVVKAVFTGPVATLAIQLQGWPLRISVLVMVIGLIFFPLAAQHRRRGRRAAGSDDSVDETGEIDPHEARRLSTTQREEALGIVESMRSSMARALLASPRRLTGQMTVATEGKDTAGFPDLRVVIRIGEKEGAAHASEVSGARRAANGAETTSFDRTVMASVAPGPGSMNTTASVDQLPSRRALRAGDRGRQWATAEAPSVRATVEVPLMRPRAVSSAPADLPSRRDHRNANRHGRRRAS